MKAENLITTYEKQQSVSPEGWYFYTVLFLNARFKYCTYKNNC